MSSKRRVCVRCIQVHFHRLRVPKVLALGCHDDHSPLPVSAPRHPSPSSSFYSPLLSFFFFCPSLSQPLLVTHPSSCTLNWKLFILALPRFIISWQTRSISRCAAPLVYHTCLCLFCSHSRLAVVQKGQAPGPSAHNRSIMFELWLACSNHLANRKPPGEGNARTHTHTQTLVCKCVF